METNTEKLLKIATQALDTDPTPKDEVADDVACAQVLSTLLQKIFLDFPIIQSTATLFDVLKKDKRFKATLNTGRGKIIISPRNAIENGHCGIFITDDRIASNDSRPEYRGLFKGNYTWQSWINDLINKRGLRTWIFEILG